MKKDTKKNVIALGWVSFLMDTSSEMIFPILPLFLANVLGVPKAFIGLIEGVAESTASILKVFSGWLSDKIRKRKMLVAMGYSVSALSKPFFALATNGFHVLLVRLTDRIGKGVRDAPRDALISESIKKQKRGKWFGFHRMMDTSGAVVGTILTFLLLRWVTTNYRTIFWLATIPAFLSVAVVLIFVRDIKHKIDKKVKLSLKGFSKNYKMFILTSVIFNLGNFSYAFYVLRAQNLGIPTAVIPLVYLTYNIVYAVFAMPAGIWSDKIGRKKVILFGYLLLAATAVLFATINASYLVWVIFVLYGLQIAFVNGNSRAFVSDLSPKNKRGTAMGIYQTAIGLAILPASIIAGTLWDLIGASAPFIYAAVISITSSIMLVTLVRK
jgi:MFS family permease